MSAPHPCRCGAAYHHRARVDLPDGAHECRCSRPGRPAVHGAVEPTRQEQRDQADAELTRETVEQAFGPGEDYEGREAADSNPQGAS